MGQAVLNNKLDPGSVGLVGEVAGTPTPTEPRYSGQMESLAKHFEALANNSYHQMLALGRSVLLDKSVETCNAFEARALELYQASIQLIQDALHPTSIISTQAELIFRHFDAGAIDQLADEQLGRFSDSIDQLFSLVAGSTSLNIRELGLRLVREGGMSDFEGFLETAEKEVVESLVSFSGDDGPLTDVLDHIYARDIDLGLDLDIGVALDMKTWTLQGPEFKELAGSARETVGPQVGLTDRLDPEPEWVWLDAEDNEVLVEVLRPNDAPLQDREIEMLEDWRVDADLEAEVFAWTYDQPDGYWSGQVAVPLLNDIVTPVGFVSYHEFA
ncbi:hypothetical protein [Pseudomonas agarici]|uniref:hypothetical protein n=1 Tax=Pseudomonas agarici TaxID=46677 RepID=UPI000316D510|nr:hypothetical protein [Pseudomonas agarici]NWB91271.1 hypothetical protein [Pseudomonas agarici]NWC08038.1 hypothetical protein [Pseudomonas agarici]SEL17061.1 hypothetical protein SAMN05216604_11297 [Pseudomonas agarici]